jgi:hypothetical protein
MAPPAKAPPAKKRAKPTGAITDTETAPAINNPANHLDIHPDIIALANFNSTRRCGYGTPAPRQWQSLKSPSIARMPIRRYDSPADQHADHRTPDTAARNQRLRGSMPGSVGVGVSC